MYLRLDYYIFFLNEYVQCLRMMIAKYSDVDPHLLYADPDPQNLVDLDIIILSPIDFIFL